MKKHIRRMHRMQNGKSELGISRQTENILGDYMSQMNKNYDIRLKENFKLFVSGPSRCGKTVFVSKLIENMQSFAKQPPESIIYVYKVWQDKYEEMESFGVNFIEDHENIIDKKKSHWQEGSLF